MTTVAYLCGAFSAACATVASSRLRRMILKSFGERPLIWRILQPSQSLVKFALQNLNPDLLGDLEEVEDPDARLALHQRWDGQLRDMALALCGEGEGKPCGACVRGTLYVTQQWAEWLQAEALVWCEVEQPVLCLSDGLLVAAGKLDPAVALRTEGWEAL